jgi:ubiquitin carboxyl-terminal hydrolase 9/24
MLIVCFSGVANEWTDLISHCLRSSRKAREYFAEEVLFKHTNRFQEYLIDCPTADVRKQDFFFFRRFD